MARPPTALFTDGLSGWLRSALPGVVIDAPDEGRGRRDRVVDATIYVVAFAISAAIVRVARRSSNAAVTPVAASLPS